MLIENGNIKRAAAVAQRTRATKADLFGLLMLAALAVGCSDKDPVGPDDPVGSKLAFSNIPETVLLGGSLEGAFVQVTGSDGGATSWAGDIEARLETLGGEILATRTLRVTSGEVPLATVRVERFRATLVLRVVANGLTSSQTTIRVVEPASLAVTLSEGHLVIQPGASVPVPGAIVKIQGVPLAASASDVVFQSSQPSIVAVEGNRLVARGIGVARVTATIGSTGTSIDVVVPDPNSTLRMAFLGPNIVPSGNSVELAVDLTGPASSAARALSIEVDAAGLTLEFVDDPTRQTLCVLGAPGLAGGPVRLVVVGRGGGTATAGCRLRVRVPAGWGRGLSSISARIIDARGSAGRLALSGTASASIQVQ